LLSLLGFLLSCGHPITKFANHAAVPQHTKKDPCSQRQALDAFAIVLTAAALLPCSLTSNLQWQLRAGNRGRGTVVSPTGSIIDDAAETILYQLMAPMAAGSPTWLGVERHMGIHLTEFVNERAAFVHGGNACPPALLHHYDAQELSDEDADQDTKAAALPSWLLRASSAAQPTLA
jgi:hypothetical protein